MALASDRGLACGFGHFSDLSDIITACAAGPVRRIGTDMNMEINRADKQVIDDSVFVSHSVLLALIAVNYFAVKIIELKTCC
jgi:hypothetical protein